ncbi:PQQ-dependent dehydrogenase, methanol/ethanol family [Niveispirillum sp.]|uniref:PQQ-dependent dehydrogenase, methanol/ethanol family n=1 Tax=Niveispirillum sp. TaxID=1917217 RepID=UPI001B5106DA|nr:PQQ-dependent dehydrogenase, methanol/ethanol family [Niveispirillum sp.]MBP7337081.1 PQQ-dependent dehydrogenase, methanol/ethanol family [Niveispirillum sp.]
MLKRLSALLLAGTLLAAAPAIANDRIRNAEAEPQNWLSHGRTYGEQRFSPLDQINPASIGRLRLAWYHDLDTNRGQEGTPLIVDGVLYTTTAWSKVVAVDAATGKPLWSHDPQVPGRAAFNGCCDVVNRGPAFADGKLFLGTLDGRLQALDARTGTLLWSVQTTDPNQPYTITGAPRVAKGKVFIGNGGAEYGVRGYVSAYDSATGKLVWRFYTVPGDPARKDGAASDAILETLGRPTWSGEDYWKKYGGGGGTVWDAIVYDPDLDQLYIGVGNGSPLNHVIRSEGKGDNLFLSSIVALDPDTGAYRWHYQEVPGESWDYTASQQIMLADLPVGGRQRKVILHAPKNGFFYVIDRQTGKTLSAEKYAPTNWATHIDLTTGRPAIVAEARYLEKPFVATVGSAGAHSWHPMAFSPQTGLVYIPVQLIPGYYHRDKAFTYRKGRWNLGYDLMRVPIPRDADGRKAMQDSLQGWLSAWDPVTQKEVWRADHGMAWNGGALATGGGLVFQGTFDGRFRAYDAGNGTELWSFAAQTSVMAGPVSYSVNGRQFIAVLAGTGGAVPLALPSFQGPQARPNGRILAFALDGAAALPPLDTIVAPPSNASVPAPAERIEQGRILYADNCGGCHGMGTLSGGILPDLRRSLVLESAEAWQQVVIEGAFQDRGMISFRPFLTAQDAETIRAYVADEAAHLRREAKEP